MHTVLLVEDDPLLAAVNVDWFVNSGYKAIVADSGNAYKAALRENDISLIMLDLALPDADGLELLRELRHKNQVPLIVVSGSRLERDRILAFSFGADEFVIKPVSPVELELRARNLLARQGQVAPNVQSQAGVVLANGWQFDISRRVLLDDEGKMQTLTQAEFALLRRLVDAKGAIVSREDLFKSLVNEVGITNRDTLSTILYRLRKKLVRTDAEDVIVTLSKVGFRVNLAASDSPARVLQG
jgi:DNA-binding response OmpR family regulator